MKVKHRVIKMAFLASFASCSLMVEADPTPLEPQIGATLVGTEVTHATIAGDAQHAIAGVTEIYRPTLLEAIATPARPFERVGSARQGGVAGMPLQCICDADCGDGDPCTVDTCDENGMCQQNTVDALGRLCEDGDGDFCTNGQCDDSGNCVGNAAGDNCGDDEECNEATDNCDGTECDTDTDCDAQDDAQACLDFSCEAGTCVAESTCAVGTVCDGMGTCEAVDGRCCADTANCTVGPLDNCNGGAGPWAALADCGCPKYSSGFNDDPAQDFTFTVIVEEGNTDCENRFRIGDDYNLSNGSYLELSTFSFIGGPATTGSGNGTLCFEIWDAAVDPPVLAQGPFCLTFDGTCNGLDGSPNPLGAGCATNADCIGDPASDGVCGTNTVARGNRTWLITFAAGLEPTIPPSGFFAMRPGAGSGETGGFLATNSAGLVGTNDPTILLENDPAQGGRIGAVLSPESDDVLAFELIGNKVPAPTGACCIGEGNCQEDAGVNTEWLCNAVGGTFNLGVTCGSQPCNVATCCAPDGSCTVEDPTTCSNAGGVIVEFGGVCEPSNCCPQPDFATDVCSVTAPADNVLDTESTASTLTLTFSGDTSDNINGGVCSVSGTPCRPYQADGEDCPAGEFCQPDTECTIGGNGPREFHTFEITSGARVEIDWCCTEGDAAPGFRWIALVDNCEGCDTVIRDAAAVPDIACNDGNPTDVFPELPAGVYNIQVFTDRYCQNSAGFTNCTQDSDCPPGEGPCFEQSGPYQMHVNATALADRVCCLGSACLDSLDQLECLAQGGTPLNDTPLCVPINPCLLGACCVSPGVCEDNGGSGISESECLNISPSAQFLGGTFCAADPCPVCDIDDDANCQRDTGSFIVQIDRAVWTPPDQVDRWADDFTPLFSGPLDRVCWWPAFFNPDQGAECSTPGETPVDDWLLRIYEDANGYPGTEIGVAQTLVPDAKISLGATSRIWQYSAPVVAPPVLQAGTCYWLEITGAGDGPGGCRTYIALSEDGNSHSVNDQNNAYGPEDVVNEIPVVPPDNGVDLAFCVSTGLNNCGVFTGACCTPDLACGDDVDFTTCNNSGGLWLASAQCGIGTCGFVDQAPTCEEAIELSAPGESCENGLPCTREFSNAFAASDITSLAGCRDGADETPIGSVVWYSYTMQPGENGTCTLSTCEDTSIDGVIAIYDDCSVALTDFYLDCGDDTCGLGGGPAQVTWECCNGVTYYFAIGGWQGDTGLMTMELSVDQNPNKICDDFRFTPLANDIFDVTGGTKSCTTDADCKADQTGPDPQTVCRDSTGDGVVDSCYVARQRYLSVKPNPINAGANYALRVSVDTGVAGNHVLGFVQQSINISAGANNGPSSYDKATIDDVPFYFDWTTVPSGIISIGDCEISPGHTYIVQTIPEGSDTANESSYSEGLSLPTCTFSGDVTGGGSPGEPPNGAQATLVDVFANVLGFQSNGNEPLDWLDTEPATGSAVPNLIVGLADAFSIVQAFQGNPYPGPTPLDCP
ncbi:MAG: hypothetical protein ACPGXK_05520 [Phycisphaerae bacterium]